MHPLEGCSGHRWPLAPVRCVVPLQPLPAVAIPAATIAAAGGRGCLRGSNSGCLPRGLAGHRPFYWFSTLPPPSASRLNNRHHLDRLTAGLLPHRLQERRVAKRLSSLATVLPVMACMALALLSDYDLAPFPKNCLLFGATLRSARRQERIRTMPGAKEGAALLKKRQ